MADPTWTPGPWNVTEEDSDEFWLGDGYYSIEPFGIPVRKTEAGKANAHLIAAAPDLYVLLKECMSGLADIEPQLEARIEAALAKAEGRISAPAPEAKQ